MKYLWNNKVLIILLILSVFLVVGCGEEMTPKQAVMDYMESYVTLDDSVVTQLNEYVDNDSELNDEQKKIYKEILRKQYSSLTYEIGDERIDGNTAYVKVKINVKDLYRVRKDSNAYYEKIDCMSSPASTQENKNQYMLPFFYSETGVNDEAEQNIGVYPNPANEKVTVDAQNINSVSVVNVMGQKVYESTSVNEDKVVIDVNEYPSGIYMIHVVTDEYETTKRVSIAH